MRTHRCLLLALLLATTGMALPASADPPREALWIVGFHALPADLREGGTYAGARIYGVTPATDAIAVASADPWFKARAAADANVRYVEPDLTYSIAYTPDDPLHAEQDEQAQVRLPAAWDRTLGSPAATVCVVDTGVRHTHEDLRGPRFLGGHDFVNNDTDPWDDHGHGTHVTGVAAATVANARGIAGAGNVGFYAVKAMGANGRGLWSHVASAISWCADNAGPNAVVSLSLSGGYSQDVHDAIRYATQTKGLLVVAAAGNGGPCTDCVRYPAALPEVVAVTCTTASETLCSFSSQGPQADLAAPGEDILSTCNADDASYCTRSGTSSSTPLVSGVAALFWSANPGLTGAQVRERLLATAQDLGPGGHDPHFGHGELDAKCLFENRVPCQPPPNDAYAKAEPIPVLPFRKDANTRLATVELGEPMPCGPAGATVWYQWTAPASGRVRAEAAGSGFDAVLSAYASSLASLVKLGCSKDDALGGNARSVVEFDARAGVTYAFQVGGLGGDAGNVRLHFTCAGCPANNAFERAAAIDGVPHSARQLFTGAGMEPGEPAPCAPAAGTVWYRWQAPGPGLAAIDTLASGFDTVLAVYAGSSLATLRQVACNDDAPGTTRSQVTFQALGGATYFIQVGGRLDATGELRLALQCPACVQAPPHDAFSAARVFTDVAVHETGTLGATEETGEPRPCGQIGRTVWYSFTPQHDALAIVNTEDSGYDTVLAAYTGGTLSELSLVTCLDDVPGWNVNTARIVLDLKAGVTYHVQAGGFQGAAGPLRLKLECFPACFPTGQGNDMRANATPIAALPYAFEGDNLGYGTEPGETRPPSTGATAWFRYAHPADAPPQVVTVDTYGSTFNTVLAAYATDAYLPLAYSDDEPDLTGASLVRFTALPGQTYHVQAGGFMPEFYPEQGLLRLNAR